jgi:hypothetical protein
MTTHPGKRMAALPAIVLAVLLVAPAADADVYTWVDAKGNVNVSNLEPPEGARILGVTRENPAAKAQAEAAREAARQGEVKALAERVAELESKTEAAFNAPPPVAYPPPVPYAPPPPAPQYNVIVMPPEQPDYASAYASYGCAWVGCYTAWPPLFYPAAVFFTNQRDHHHDFHRPRHVVPTPPHGMPPAPKMPVAAHAAAHGFRS